MLTSCNNNTTPEAWSWTVDDSTAIMALLEPQEVFLSTKDHLPDSQVIVSIPSDLMESVKEDTGSIRYHANGFSFSITDSVYAYKFESAVDTTVTGFVFDTLKGLVTITTDSFLPQGSDTLIPLDTTLSKPFRFSSRGAVFFDSLDATTTWRIAKYSGGSDGQTPDVASSPVLDSLRLEYGSNNLKVIFPADTSVYGIRGLFDTSKFVTIATGGSISLEGIYPTAGDILILYVKGEEGWLPYEQNMSVTFSKKGKTHLYVIGISLSSLIYASNDWSSVLWGIPVIVK
jgi:hypothetical protein